ncbi:MAG: metallophosphoesterase [Pseudomonadota bacterium]
MPLFLIFALALWGGLHTWLLWRTHLLLTPPAIPWRITVGAVGVLAVLYVVGRILTRFGRGSAAAAAVELTGAWWLALASIAVSIMFLVEAAGLLSWLATRIGTGRGVTIFGLLAPGPRWARLSVGGLIWGLALVGTIIGAASATQAPREIRLAVEVPQVPDGLGRLVQVSDLHLGAILSRGQWETIIDTIEAAKPDALLLTGDIIEDHTVRGHNQLRQLRERFPGTPFFMTTGNHEKYSGLDHLPALAASLEIRLLRQEAVDLGGLWLAGVDDPQLTDYDVSVPAVRRLVPPGAPMILLSHQPQVIRRLADRPDTLVLSGHVHGGQLPPFQLLAPLSNGGYLSGLYRVGDAALHLSNGAGTWGPPVRLFAPPDIVVLELEQGDAFSATVQ